MRCVMAAQKQNGARGAFDRMCLKEGGVGEGLAVTTTCERGRGCSVNYECSPGIDFIATQGRLLLLPSPSLAFGNLLLKFAP